jgi:hypothetical protein
VAHVLIGEPVSTPDQVRGRLSPEHALGAAIAAASVARNHEWRSISLRREYIFPASRSGSFADGLTFSPWRNANPRGVGCRRAMRPMVASRWVSLRSTHPTGLRLTGHVKGFGCREETAMGERVGRSGLYGYLQPARRFKAGRLPAVDHPECEHNQRRQQERSAQNHVARAAMGIVRRLPSLCCHDSAGPSTC